MKEHPIIFSGPMVRAIMAGRKTQTRRVVHFKSSFSFPHIAYTHCWQHSGGGWVFCDADIEPGRRKDYEFGGHGMMPPYGNVGDRLWVRERVIQMGHERTGRNGQYLWPKLDYDAGRKFLETQCYYAADLDHDSPAWDEPHGTLSAMFMPRWASRITLEITDVRVQRVQEISANDAIEEGIDGAGGDDEYRNRSSVENFARLWDSINGTKYPWADNPWVWAMTFKIIAG